MIQFTNAVEANNENENEINAAAATVAVVTAATADSATMENICKTYKQIASNH